MILFNFFVCSHRICTFIALYTLSELSYSCRACEKSILSTLLSQCPAKSIKLIALSVTVLYRLERESGMPWSDCHSVLIAPQI